MTPIVIFTIFIVQRNIFKFKNLIFKKLGYTSIEQPEPQYFIEAETYCDGAPTNFAPEAPAALVIMAVALAPKSSGSAKMK
jgi:hypothetical protein